MPRPSAQIDAEKVVGAIGLEPPQLECRSNGADGARGRAGIGVGGACSYYPLAGLLYPEFMLGLPTGSWPDTPHCYSESVQALIPGLSSIMAALYHRSTPPIWPAAVLHRSRQWPTTRTPLVAKSDRPAHRLIVLGPRSGHSHSRTGSAGGTGESAGTAVWGRSCGAELRAPSRCAVSCRVASTRHGQVLRERRRLQERETGESRRAGGLVEEGVREI